MRLELGRVVRRWQQLPLDRASLHVPRVRAVAAALFELGDDALLPQLSPAATMDQLRVAVFDACAAGHQDAVLDQLAQLRRAIG